MTKEIERCDSCGRHDKSVATCVGCWRLVCDRKKCQKQHDGCATPDELAEP